MIDYSQWPRKKANVTSLLLDLENPRIPFSQRPDSQSQVLAMLVKEEEVYDLAKKMVSNGYYVDESLIAMKSDSGRLIVLEGNRRLAALKALVSPEAVPESHRKKFRTLSYKADGLPFKQVPIIVAPSRDSAFARISEKHTESQVKQWKPVQKARFYQSQLDEGWSIERISDAAGLTESEVRNSLRTFHLYKMACSLDLPDPVKAVVLDAKKFTITTLERFFASQACREFLAVEQDGDYAYKGVVPTAEFIKGFGKVVTDIAMKDLDSRVIHGKEEIATYLERIKDYKPSRRKKGSFNSEDLISTPKAPVTKKPKTPKKPPVKRPNPYVIPKDMMCDVENQRINDVFKELKKLKMDGFENAVSVTLRVLLDISVSEYIDQLGRTEDLIKRVKGKGKRPPDWHPTLRQMLLFLIEVNPMEFKPLELKALKQLRDSRDTTALDTLDGFVHNMHMQPTEKEINSVFAKVQGLLRVVLAKPGQAEEQAK